MEVWKGPQWWDAYVHMPGRPNFIAYGFSSNQSDFMHANALGSLTTVTNASGAPTGDELYYPWGELWTAVTGTPAHYWAGFDYWNWETDTGPTLYRTYSFSKGRWLSPDPAGLAAVDLTNPQSLNRYAYVLNKPTTLTDPPRTLLFHNRGMPDGRAGDWPWRTWVSPLGLDFRGRRRFTTQSDLPSWTLWPRQQWEHPAATQQAACERRKQREAYLSSKKLTELVPEGAAFGSAVLR